MLAKQRGPSGISGDAVNIASKISEDYGVVNMVTITARVAEKVKGLDGAAPFYTNPSWENVPVAQFEGGMKIKAGTVIDYACDYSNTAANDVYQGPSATDELCMAIGSLATMFFTGNPVGNYADAKRAVTSKYGAFFRQMLDRGFFLAPSQFEAAFVSAAHTTEDIDRTIVAAVASLEAIAAG